MSPRRGSPCSSVHVARVPTWKKRFVLGLREPRKRGGSWLGFRARLQPGGPLPTRTRYTQTERPPEENRRSHAHAVTRRLLPQPTLAAGGCCTTVPECAALFASIAHLAGPKRREGHKERPGTPRAQREGMALFAVVAVAVLGTAPAALATEVEAPESQTPSVVPVARQPEQAKPALSAGARFPLEALGAGARGGSAR